MNYLLEILVFDAGYNFETKLETINKRFVLIAKPLRGFACKMDAYLFRNINVGIKKLRVS